MSGRPRRRRFSAAALLLLALAACGEPDTVASLLERGADALERGDTATAITLYERALEKEPRHPLAMAGLARAEHAQGDRQAADYHFRQAANITYQRGLNAAQAGDDSAAAVAFEQTLSIIDEHPLALNRLGEIALRQGQDSLAVAYYGRSAAANPGFADTFLALGELHLARGDTSQARAAFEAAVTANVNAVTAYEQLGLLDLHRGDWSQAAAQFERALLIRPDSRPALEGLAQATEHTQQEEAQP